MRASFFSQVKGIELIEDFFDLRIDVADGGIISVDGESGFGFGFVDDIASDLTNEKFI